MMNKIWLLKAENWSLQVKKKIYMLVPKENVFTVFKKDGKRWKYLTLLTVHTLEWLSRFFQTSQSCALQKQGNLSFILQIILAAGSVEVVSSGL